MRVVVTGANGLVGSRLVRQLVARGHQVLAVGRGAQRITGPGFQWLSAELSDAAAMTAGLSAFAPQAIVNPAGATDVDGCERDPLGAYAANVEGVAVLCKVARSTGAHLVHVSTDYVFDGEAGPYDTDAIPNPRGTYAITKHLGEQTVKALLPATQWAIARTAVVCGWPNAGKNNFGSWLIDSFSQKKPVKLFEDQVVSASLALNVAEMLGDIAARSLSGMFHTCGAEAVDRVTFGKRLCERFGFDASLITPSRMADVKLLSPRPARSGLRVDSTAARLTAKPMTLAQTLDGLYAEYTKGT